jgi:hypothetical protein
MLNRIKAAVGTMAITGMLVLPAWAMSFPFPPTQPPEPNTGCANIIAEVEPNDLATSQDFHHLGSLAAGGCVGGEGTIASGSGPDPSNPAPNADLDFYGVFDLTGISQIEFDVIPDAGTAFYGVFDAATGKSLIDQCTGLPCVFSVPAGVPGVGVAVGGDTALGYTFSLTDATAGGFPSAAGSRHLLAPQDTHGWQQTLP